MPDVVVIGAGFGGLAAAIRLAAAGRRVVIAEAAAEPGGKAGTAEVDGVVFDTGPSVLTLPDVLDGVLRDAHVSLGEVLAIRRPEPFTRYTWPDGVALDLGGADAVRDALGAKAAAEFTSFLAYCKGIWDEAAPSFVYGAAPGIGTLRDVGLARLARFHRIDPLRTMRSAIDARVSEPHLRDVFLRFATYNGSDPRTAPATLNCIAHVELGLGGVGVEGGLRAVVDALVAAAVGLGVELRLGCRVERILGDRAVTGVALAGGEEIRARQVVSNADVAHLPALAPAVAREIPQGEPSTSGWTAVVRARRQARAHQVDFPRRYDAEFEDLFDHRRSPVEPTVYTCAQDLAHGRRGWTDGRAPLFVMANAPALPAPDDTAALAERILGRLRAAGRIDAADPVVWSRGPAELAARFPGSAGALYGNASNSMFSAFRRMGNRVRALRGLYVASGSAHPGGGVPLCLLSGREAARCALDDDR